MKVAILLLLAVFSSANSLYTPEEYAEMQKKVSFETLSYEEYYEQFKNVESLGSGMSLEDLNRATLAFSENYKIESELMGYKKEEEIVMNGPLPLLYDLRRDAYKSSCFRAPIKNQMFCGSCYAFATTYVLAKRFCMHDRSGRYQDLDLSPQDHIECDYKAKKCQGGILPYNWQFLENEGVCSEQCKPYVSGRDGRVGYCSRYCSNYRMSYRKYRARRGSLAFINGIEEIKKNILLYGPVTTSMEAHKDMSMYRGGIYKWSNDGSDPEGHAVTLVGWGYDSRYGEYWIVANSWGSQWGEQGYFKIPFGESNIAAIGALASMPDFDY